MGYRLNRTDFEELARLQQQRVKHREKQGVGVQLGCFQGTLLRYTAGNCAEMHIQRWGVLSSTEFMYFRTKFSALFNEKPLGVIPFDRISAVQISQKSGFYLIQVMFAEESLSCGSSTPRHHNPTPSKFTVPNVHTVLVPSPGKAQRKGLLRKQRQSWTCRENSAFRSEKQLVFAVPTENERGRWIEEFENRGIRIT